MVGNESTDATSSEKEIDMNLEAQYETDGGLDDACRLQNEGTTNDGDALRESNLKVLGSKASMDGRWGSTFWKDCQPMFPQNSLDSGKEPKSGSDYGNAGGSEDNSLDGETGRVDSVDDVGQKEACEGRKSHSCVPAEEMLSDE
ncbi:hypothetical protein RYX36_016978 [Vicia faba]